MLCAVESSSGGAVSVVLLSTFFVKSERVVEVQGARISEGSELRRNIIEDVFKVH